ncbi:MAG TPA: hypothetical protein PL163_25395 [Leptospiraceae bacterium]|nr:hypothetical protein [Leptospiraceae bacterium]
MKIIIFAAIVILSNCEVLEPIWTDKNQKKRDKDFGTLIMWSSITGGPQIREEAQVTDNKDGTLYYTYIKRQINWPGNPILEQKTILVQRCLIGQVYRPAENDCRGTGTKGTTWGALKFQWCPTNDRSCEKDGVADPALSPAAKACADSNFLGKKWGLGSKTDSLSLYLSNTQETLKLDFSTINELRWITIYFWIKESNSSDAAFYSGTSENKTVSKSTALNVLCKGII